MSDDFLKSLKQDARQKFYEETFEIDTSGFGSEQVPQEKWRIQPLPAFARDKVIQCVQAGEYYKGLATSLVYRAYRGDAVGRRFRPADVQGLMENPDFLDWIADEIDFKSDIDFLAEDEDETKKK